MQLFYNNKQKTRLYFVFYRSKSNAFDSCSKVLRYAPSQNGLLADSPQLQRPKTVLPYKPYTIKLESVISKSPSILMDLLLLIISFVLIMHIYFFEFKGYKIYVHHFVFSLLLLLKLQFILILFYSRFDQRKYFFYHHY
jgi:hypothetical protein